VKNVHWPNYPCKNDWCGRLLLPEILGQTDRAGVKLPIFLSIFARSASALTPSEKT